MAAKGTQSKNNIFKTLKQFYPDAFWEEEGKILRIPQEENGEIVEIKVQLTAAKVPMTKISIKTSAFENDVAAEEPKKSVTVAEPTVEEKENVEKLLRSLNF